MSPQQDHSGKQDFQRSKRKERQLSFFPFAKILRKYIFQSWGKRKHAGMCPLILLLVIEDTPNQSLSFSVKVTEKTHMYHRAPNHDMNYWVWSSVNRMHDRVILCLLLVQNQHFCWDSNVLWLYVKPPHFSVYTQNHNLLSFNFSQPGCPILESENSLPHPRALWVQPHVHPVAQGQTCIILTSFPLLPHMSNEPPSLAALPPYYLKNLSLPRPQFWPPSPLTGYRSSLLTVSSSQPYTTLLSLTLVMASHLIWLCTLQWLHIALTKRFKQFSTGKNRKIFFLSMKFTDKTILYMGKFPAPPRKSAEFRCLIPLSPSYFPSWVTWLSLSPGFGKATFPSRVILHQCPERAPLN